MRLCYGYEIVEDDGERFLEFASFPEVVCSVSLEEAKNEEAARIALDALTNALQARIDYSDVIPDPEKNSRDNNQICLFSPLISAKVLLYREFLNLGISRAELARRIDCTATAVSRLFDLSHASRFDVVMEAFEAIGLNLETELKLTKKR
ncbi:MAG: hypothetical protein WA790_06680 [Sulfitobacter sp.]